MNRIVDLFFLTGEKFIAQMWRTNHLCN